MRSKKTKEEIFKESFALFTNCNIPDDIFNDYINDETGFGSYELQSWIISNMRCEIADWCTGIGVIDAVEILYKNALENGNLSIKQNDSY